MPKKNTNADNFENAFDKLMQSSNYNETAGIIIGPEVSRIFAEIILQQIDVDIQKKLTQKQSPLTWGIDYDIRRYVDDYFVFAKNNIDLTTIQSTISECLAPYRLSLNESKTIHIERPFSSPETRTRIEIAKILVDFFKKSVSSTVSTDPTSGKEKTTYKPRWIKNSERMSNVVIRDIKSSSAQAIQFSTPPLITSFQR